MGGAHTLGDRFVDGSVATATENGSRLRRFGHQDASPRRRPAGRRRVGALFASADLGRTERALELWCADAWIAVDPSPDALCSNKRSMNSRCSFTTVTARRALLRPARQLVFSTSGSTGDPRLVTCPDERFTAVSCTIADTLGLNVTDRILSASPPHFDYGFNQFVLAASSGACLIQGDYLSLGHLLGNDQQPPTVLATGPSQLRLIAELPDANVRAAGLRLLTSMGRRSRPRSPDRLRALWPKCEIRSMYGMTECKRVSISTHDEFVSNPASVGHPIRGVSVSIDETTNEILVTTQYLMEFESSPQSIGPRVIDIDGRPTLATGDCGRLTADGQLEIIGRLSQYAKIHDVRVSLAEAEQVAMRVRERAGSSGDDAQRSVVHLVRARGRYRRGPDRKRCSCRTCPLDRHHRVVKYQGHFRCPPAEASERQDRPGRPHAVLRCSPLRLAPDRTWSGFTIGSRLTGVVR